MVEMEYFVHFIIYCFMNFKLKKLLNIALRSYLLCFFK
jgi:hypothetical protein